jgi:hypothetical protein
MGSAAGTGVSAFGKGGFWTFGGDGFGVAGGKGASARAGALVSKAKARTTAKVRMLASSQGYPTQSSLFGLRWALLSLTS